MRARFVLRLSSLIANPLLVGLVAAAPLLANGGFLLTRGGGDSPFLLVRLHQLIAALAGGQFPARWMPDAAFGFGYPFFSYYASFPYYLAAALHAYGFSYVAALKLTQTAALIAGAAGMYAWVRRMPFGGASAGLSRAGAWLAAAAYTFAPFHLANLYVRGDSLSELWAMGLFPFALWAAQACLDQPTVGRALRLSAVVGLLIITHNISALNFLPFLILYGLLMAVPGQVRSHPGARGERGRMGRMALAGAGLAWGLGLAAFFWLPALGEIGAVQPADLTAGYFFYGNHFRGLDLVQPTFFYNAETAPGLPSPFAMGLAQAALAAAGAAALAWRSWRARRWTSSDTFILAGLAISTYMMMPASAWAWERLPLLRFTQFPWRFLSIQALFTAAATGHLVPVAREGLAGTGDDSANPTRRWPRLRSNAIPVVLGGALALLGLGGLRPEFIPLTDADVTAERLQVIEYFTGNIGSTIGAEYLPREVTPRPFASDELLRREAALKVLAGTAEGQRLWQRGAAEGWTVTATGGPARVALPIYYWPGWRATVDGQPAEAAAAPGLGWISVEVSAGTHVIELRLGRTPVRAAGEALSVAAALVAVVWWAREQSRRGARRDTQANRQAAKRYGWIAAMAALAVLGPIGLRLWPERAPGGAPLSMDFAQLAYPHRDEVRFEGGARLTAIEYSTQHAARGKHLVINSTWAGAGGGVVTLGLAPGSNLISQAPVTLAAAETTVGEGTLSVVRQELILPSDMPPGVYFVTVQVSEAGRALAAVTRGGRERGLVHLGPIWVDDDGAAAEGATLAALGEQFTLLEAAAAGTQPGVVEVRLTWQARQAIAANLQLGLRLRDAEGFEWAGSDSQLAYGFYPTFMWRSGEVVPDFYRLKTPPGTPPGEYTVDVYMYEPASGNTLGTFTFSAAVENYTPRGERTAQHALTPELEIGSVILPERFNQGEAPEFRVEWLTTGTTSGDYRARWTLIAEDGTRVAQVLDLTPGAPTSQWPPDAFLIGRTRFGTESTLSPARYTVALALVDEAGAAASAEVSVGEVEVAGRPRSYVVPPLDVPVGATFGEALILHGYNSEQDGETLRLTLVWGALTAPGRDYKYFVHLYNQADGFVAQQVDAVPHDFTYPTVLWTAGEVVTDTVTFDIASLPPGSYGLAVGWYDPNTPDLVRLPAHDAAGAPLEADRVILLEHIEAP